MPIENRWYAEPLIVLNRMYGEMTIAELSDNDHMNQTYYDHLPEGALLHFIVDMREVTHMPNDLRATRTVSAPRPNTGWIVLVTSDPLHKMIASMISLVMHLRYKVVASLDEALDFLRQHDAALWPLIGKPAQDDEQDAQA
jgi:hypothetical protein